jgi:hypothetical protein
MVSEFIRKDAENRRPKTDADLYILAITVSRNGV